MRRLRLLILAATLSACLGSSDCSEGSARGTTPGGGSGVSDGGGPVSAMPEPGSAVVFGAGALIAAAVVRRKRVQG